jgi:hypothetical protein
VDVAGAPRPRPRTPRPRRPRGDRSRYGYRALRLQTGDLQTAPIALYRSAGYRPIASYGRYRDEPRCLCFEKVLATG